MIYCVDANVFLTAWYTTYPPVIFESLWKKIAEKAEYIEIIRPVYNEIEPVSSNYKKKFIEFLADNFPVRTWIDTNSFPIIDIDEDVNNSSIQLEMKYQISNVTKGAGQVDMTLIAYAKQKPRIVVTLEAKQPNRPDNIANYKIPLIYIEENVKCIDFVEMLTKLNIAM